MWIISVELQHWMYLNKTDHTKKEDGTTGRTTTLDVFKCRKSVGSASRYEGRTTTLDVFKYVRLRAEPDPDKVELQHWMYLNTGSWKSRSGIQLVELQHWMYLNWFGYRNDTGGVGVELQHWMYLNSASAAATSEANASNYNIGCI